VGQQNIIENLNRQLFRFFYCLLFCNVPLEGL
jgi:hypothetical protein